MAYPPSFENDEPTPEFEYQSEEFYAGMSQICRVCAITKFKQTLDTIEHVERSIFLKLSGLLGFEVSRARK